jgi:hypothetical protein
MAFVSAGFAVESYDNPHDMEWTKLLANSLGTTSSVTGLTPRETFADDALFSLELRGLRERIAIIKAGGIKLLNIPWAKTPLMRLGAMALPAHPPEAIKRMIGETIAEGRRNLPSAATRRIMEGKDPSEALRYHLPFIQLASQTGLTASIDAAIADIVGQHLRGEINLREMTSPQKIELLLARLH